MSPRQFRYLLLISLTLLSVSKKALAQSANFTSNVVDGCSPLTINFQNLSTGTNLNYLWDFGNGNQSTQQNPGAIYIQDGTYTIKLKVWNSSGIDSIVKTAYITVFAKPVTNFGLSSAVSSCAPAQVNFTDSSQIGSYPIQSWLYDFGDGSVSSAQNPQHVYQQGGIYSVSLQITDTKGCSHVLSKSNYVRVSSPFPVDYSVTNSVSCSPPLTSSFQANVSGGLSPYTYYWDFDDGNNSNQQNPTHQFTSSKLFNVSLTVTDANGCSQTMSKKSVNTTGPKADYKLSATSGCAPFLLNVKDASTPPAPLSSIQWSIGPFQSSRRDTSILLTQAGKYHVKWKATTGACSDSLFHTDVITVLPSPDISFEASDTILCAPIDTVRFVAQGSGVVSWKWTFNNGDSSNQRNPSVVFSDSSKKYTIRLEGMNNVGCKSVVEKSSYINKQMTTVEAFADTFDGCFPYTTNFTSLGSSLTPIVSYTWSFGNGDSAFTQNTRYAYPDTGKFKAVVEVIDQMGCTAKAEKTVRLGMRPRPFFTVDTTFGCSLGLSPKFTSQSQDSSACFIDEYKWNFGHPEIGESIIENPNPDYYVEPGNYNVKLIVGNNGCYDTLEKKGLIQVIGPHAEVFNPDDPCEFDMFEAKDLSFGGNKKWWTFSDGHIEFGADSVYHRFTESSWHAAFYITDTLTGCWDSILFPGKLFVPFDAQPKFEGTLCAPASITYKSNLFNVDSVLYEFGNGFSTSDSSFTVIFSDPGRYSRKLTITSKQGCKRLFYDSVEVEIKGVKAEGLVLSDSFCLPHTLKMVDLTADNPSIVEKKWILRQYGQFDIVEETTEYELVAPPPFQQDGMSIILSVKDDFGCTSTKDFQVYPFLPNPSVSVTQEADCNAARYRFKVLNQGKAGYEPVDFEWFYPGGSTKYPQYLGTLPANQWHNIVLQSTDYFGCVRKDTFPVYGKGGKIKTAFEATPKFSSCPPLLVSFSDSSLPGEDPIVAWKWDFGDGTTSTLQNPKKNYLVPGSYAIKLEVIDSKGCKSEHVIPDLIIVDGPTGVYSFTPNEGCESVNVAFSSSNVGATTIEWDLGDGNLGHGANFSHLYSRPGMYIPLMILSNDGGCKYTLPPQDTIIVRDVPVANYTSNEACAGTPQTLTSTSNAVEGTMRKEEWFWKGQKIDTGNTIHPVFNQPGYERVLLRIETNFGCVDSIYKDIAIPGINLEIQVEDTMLCLGEPAVYHIKENGFLDSIQHYIWDFGTGQYHIDSSDIMAFQYPAIGPFKTTVFGVSKRGCKDTLVGPGMLVGDTVAPNAPEIYRVTIGTNMEYLAEFASSKHIDFHQYLLDLQEVGSDFYRVANKNKRFDTTFSHPALNTLHHVYRFRVLEENACGKISEPLSSAIHGSIELDAVADTNAVHLYWNPYEGWAPKYYVIERENELDASVFDSIGFVSADSFHYIDTLIRCYAHPNYGIRAVKNGTPSLFSNSDTSKANPPYKPELPIHNLKRISVEYDREILADWNEPFYSKFPISGYLLEYSKDGNAFYSVKDWLDETERTLTKTSLMVDDQSYFFRIRVKDSCGDIGPPGPESRSILLKTAMDSLERPVLRWSSYLGWENKPEYYTVERIEPDGSIIELAEVGPEDTVYVDEITENVGRPDYCYRITANQNPAFTLPVGRQVWSHSNISCAPVTSKIFAPNAFTPNGDNLNESYEPIGIYIYRYHIQIFTRWGEKIYESESFKEQWDGQYKGVPCQEDVYIYVIDALGTDGIRYNLKGNITLLP